MSRKPYSLVAIWQDGREQIIGESHNPIEAREFESRVARNPKSIARIELRDLTGPLETLWAAAWDSMPVISNVTLYNGQSGNLEPDWTRFDALEVNCCMDYGRGITTCDLHEAEFFTVYGHLKGGMVEAITDVSTRKLANTIAQMFAAKIGEGARVFDVCWTGNKESKS